MTATRFDPQGPPRRGSLVLRQHHAGDRPAANGSVTVVSLTTFTVLNTIQLGSSIPNPRSIASNFNFPAGNVFVGAQNSAYVGVIRTDTDVVSAQLLVQGNVVDLHTTNQYAAQSATNNNIQSRSVGSGEP